MEKITCERQVSLPPSTADESTHTVKCVLATSGQVYVRDSRGKVIAEELVVGGLINDGSAPFIMDHSVSARNTIGRVTDISVDSQSVVGNVEFDADDRVALLMWGKVQKRHITDVSIGYSIYEYVLIPAGKSEKINGALYQAPIDATLRVVTRFQINEVSLVVVGADPSAKFRSATAQNHEETPMPDPETPDVAAVDSARAAKPAPPAAQHVDLEAERNKGASAERARISEIRKLNLPGDLESRAISEGWDASTAAAEGYKSLRASTPEPVEQSVRVTVGATGQEAARDAILAAWCERSGVRHEPTAEARRNARDFRDASLHTAARVILEAEGERTANLSTESLGRRAFSATAFTSLLTGMANASLKTGYAEAPGTFQRCFGRRNVNNFLTHTEIDIKLDGTIQRIGTGGKIEYLSASDSKETYRAYSYGVLFGVTREAWMNDDLDSLTRIPMQLSSRFKRNVDDVGYAFMYSNTGVGPTMQEDGKALFATDHPDGANYITSVATSTLNKAGLTSAKKAFRKIKRNGAWLNITPSVLLVPPSLEVDANEWAGSQNLAIAVGGTAGSQVTVTQPTNNFFAGQGLRVEVEPRLESADSGTTAWYLLADPTQAESLVFVSVNGNDAPVLETFQQQPEVLGYMLRCYHDFGVGVVDWRGALRCKGAA